MKFFNKNRSWRTWATAFLFVAAIIVFEKMLVTLPTVFGWIGTIFSILTPFIIALIIAFVLYIPSSKLERFFKKQKIKFFKKHSRGISVIVVYILALTIIALSLSYILPFAVKSLISLIVEIPSYYKTSIEFLKSYLGEDGTFMGFNIIGLIEQFYGNITSGFNVDQLSTYANGVYKVGSAVIEVIMAIIISVYMLLAREKIIKNIGKVFSLVFPSDKIHNVRCYTVKICRVFYTYICSQVLDALVVSIVLAIAFIIIGVPYAVLFALIVGVFNLIPYFGAIIGGIIVCVVTLLSNGFVPAIITAVAILVIQQLDGNLLQPKIVGGQVGLHPFYVLLAVCVGSGLFGFAGMIIAIPITAVIKMIIIDLLEFKTKKQAEKQLEKETLE